MLIEGEKYACEACVRGHRVSNCQHTDRPLQHINKKGRPVSQCDHCRVMRRARTAHVKCDCGEKASRCAHLQPHLEGHNDTCCCHHGGRCTCAFKKDQMLDTVPESDSDADTPCASGKAHAKVAQHRRRANTVHSDNPLNQDHHGHHKATSKQNRASSKCNSYQLSRANSAASISSIGGSSDGNARKSSVDRKRNPLNLFTNKRRVKSEAASPLLNAQHMGGDPPPLDLSGISSPVQLGNGLTFDLLTSTYNPELEGQPLYSAGVGDTSVDWSHFELDDLKDDDFAPSSYSQAGAHSCNGHFDLSGSEQLPRLANTTSTSGDVSEVEDVMGGAESDMDVFGAISAGYMQTPGLLDGTLDFGAVDYQSYFKAVDTNISSDGGIPTTMAEQDQAFWLPDYDEGNAGPMDEVSDDAMNRSAADNAWNV